MGRERSSGHPWPGKTKHLQRHGVGYLDTATQQNTLLCLAEAHKVANMLVMLVDLIGAVICNILIF